MRAQTVDVKEAAGRVLCCTVFRAGGKKLLAKGHVISEEDARMLETEGMSEVWVTELEDGEVGEDEAVLLFNATHHHAQVLGLDYDRYTEWIQRLFDGLQYLCCQSFLHL